MSEQVEQTVNNNNLQQIVAENSGDLINWIKDVAQSTGNIITEQTPLFIQEYINYTLYSSIMGLFGSIFTLFVFVILFIKLKSISKDNDRDDYSFSLMDTPFPEIALAIFFIFGFLAIPYHVDNIIKCVVAPRVLIVEKASRLIK